jgi:hypothetical protein
MNHFTAYVRQAETPALVFISKFLVVNTQLMQERCLEIVNMYGVFYNVVAKLIGLSIGNSGLHTTAGHPDGKAAGVVITAITGIRQNALGVIRAAKFAAPDD